MSACAAFVDLNPLTQNEHLSSLTNEFEPPADPEKVVDTFEHICDIAAGESLKKKHASALKHINFALKSMKNNDYNCLDDIPFDGFTDALAGQMGTYMACHATKYLKSNGVKISLLTAMSYMSTFKNATVNKFR